jgi:surfeit locus 1 family protein
MKRGTIIAGLVTALACGAMIKLGLWQLQRADWKNGLLIRYANAQALPEMAYPATPDPKNLPLFRRAAGHCIRVTAATAVAGRNPKGQTGWSHIVTCGNGAEGPGITVDIGWSRQPDNPVWQGGPVSGVIGQDPKALIRLISARPLTPGLEPSQPPSIEEIPNNHFGYAIQWFLFAGIAAAIFLIAAYYRKRSP